MATLDELKAERKALVRAEIDSYSPEYFPGSAKWRENKRCKNAVDAFDSAHPEVLAAIKAEPKPVPAYVNDPNSFYNRALRGED